MAGPWTNLLDQTITVADESSKSAYGDPTFGAQYTMLARVEFGSKKIRNAMGNTVESEAVVVTDTVIPRTSRVWLPGDNTGGDGRKVITQRHAAPPGRSTTILYETYF